MFANAIKVDVNVSPRKKIATLVSKPRTASIQEGEDDVPINAAIILPAAGLLGPAPSIGQEPCATPNMLQLGSVFFEISSVEPKKDTVKPNFRTPPR